MRLPVDIDIAVIDRLLDGFRSDDAGADVFAELPDDATYPAFCVAFSRRVAHAYAEGGLTFAAADRAMNCLYVFSYVLEDRGMPDYAWDVFNAFDAGEYLHPGDADDVDPEAKYTRPEILAIVARDAPEGGHSD